MRRWIHLAIAGLAAGALSACAMTTAGQGSPIPKTTSEPGFGTSSVFILGGIHQAHEKAKRYTYERMGEIFDHLRPDVLCVEVEQRFLDDGSYNGMPNEFRRAVTPSARRLGIPIVGIDWWDEAKGKQWEQLQAKAYSDPALGSEAALIGGVFQLLNDYFQEKDFREINSPRITSLWEAKSELKYEVYRQHPAYRFLSEFERERNDHMVENVAQALSRHPAKRVLVAVGIDHKYYLERELRRRGVRVLTSEEVAAEWWQ